MLKKTKNFIITISLFTILLFLVSCSIDNSETEPLDLTVSVIDLDSKTIAPDGGLSSTKVTKYRLSGVGPKGTKFDWKESTNGTFKVIGILQGMWTLNAESYTANNTKIATGQIVVPLSAGNKKATIVLKSLYGRGTAKINVTWNTTMVKNPVVEMRVKPVNGTYTTKTFKTKTNGNALYEEVLTSGSYIVNALLYEDSTKTKIIAGTADALRIVDGKISNGSLALIIGNIATDYNITINDQTMAPIEGTINAKVGEPNASDKSIVTATVTLSPNTVTVMKSVGATESDINIEWFLDGVPLTDENKSDNKFTGTFTITAGNSKLSALLTSSKLGSSGNCYTQIYSTISNRIVLKPGEILSPSDTMPFAPEGKFIVGYTPIQANVNDYTKSISLPYTNTNSSPVTLYPIMLDQNVLTTNTNGSVKIKDTYKNIKLLIFPGNGITAVSNEGFRYCSSLISATIAPSVISLGSSSFRDCTALKSVKISEGTTTIYNDAFVNCSTLETVILPNSITTIHNWAFAMCPTLKSITIPSNAKTLGATVFSSWTNKQTIRIESIIKPSNWNVDWNKNCSANVVWGCNLPKITIENLSKGSTYDYKSSDAGVYGLTVGSMQNAYIIKHKYYQRAIAKFTTSNQTPKEIGLWAQSASNRVATILNPAHNTDYMLSSIFFPRADSLGLLQRVYMVPNTAIQGVITYGKQSIAIDLDQDLGEGITLNNCLENLGYTTNAAKKTVLDAIPYFAETYTIGEEPDFDIFQYTPLEYIESTGTQYIDTKTKPTNTTEVRVTFSAKAYGSFLYGSRTKYQSPDAHSYYLDSLNQVYPQFCNQQEYISNSSGIDNLNEKYNFKMSQSGAFINDKLIKSFSNVVFNSNINMALFGLFQGATGNLESRTFKGAVYSFEVFEKGFKILHLIPCIRKIDNQVCMFDLVSGQFFINQGTGNFIAGSPL